MSNNDNLLTEAQVRQFMKLANLEPLTPGFVHGLHEAEEVDERKVVDFGGEGGSEIVADKPTWSVSSGGKTTHGTDAEGTHIKADKPPHKGQELSKDQRRANRAAGYSSSGHRTKAGQRTAEAPHKAGKSGRKVVDFGGEGGSEIVADKPTWSVTQGGKTTHHTDAEGSHIRGKKPSTSGAVAKEKQQESHGRGRGEGAAGYGHPDDNGRAGARLREQLPPEEEDLAPLDMEEEPLEDEFPPEEEMDLGPPEGGREVSVDDFLAALEVALEDVLGDEVEVDQEGEEDELDVEEDPLGGDDKRKLSLAPSATKKNYPSRNWLIRLPSALRRESFARLFKISARRPPDAAALEEKDNLLDK